MQAQPNPAELLRLAQTKISQSLDRTLRYMCTQTIDRAGYEPDVNSGHTSCDAGPARPAMHLTTWDRLRLDVAMTSTGEMYSWVGENRFHDRDLTDMVQEGAISTGNFAAFLEIVFRTDDTSFTYNGDSSENGRSLAEFGFRVPYAKSHYRYGRRGDRVLTGYDGTFLVDADTGELIRLVVRTSRLPAETGACYATTTLDYARVRLTDVDALLLPTDSRLRIVGTDGSESENHTVFSACHRFLGESTISFDSPSGGVPSAAHQGAAQRCLTIPPGLKFRVALTEKIDTRTAAAGDPIKAKLTTPIRNGSSVLVPAGAAVRGRIVRLRQFYVTTPVRAGGSVSIVSEPYPSVVVNVRLETLEVDGASMNLSAVADIGGRFQKTEKGRLQRRIELGTLRSLEDRSALFVFRNFHGPHLPSGGMESRWVTANPAAGDSLSTQE